MKTKETSIINSYGKKITILKGANFISDQVLKHLMFLDVPIYFSDAGLYHWFFDHKIDGIWIESVNINNEITELQINLFK